MKPSHSSLKRWFFRSIAAAVLLIGAGICVQVYLGISHSVHAEKTLHAINLVTVVVDHFVQQEQRWPTSWAELHEVTTVDAPSMYSWPEDSETVQEFVVIDFASDLTVVASQSVEEFDAISPIGAHYPYKKYGFVASLIESSESVNKAQP